MNDLTEQVLKIRQKMYKEIEEVIQRAETELLRLQNDWNKNQGPRQDTQFSRQDFFR